MKTVPPKRSQTSPKAAPGRRSFTDLWQNILNHKLTTLLLLFAVLLNFAANYSSVFDRKLDLNGDNIYYFSLGKALSEGKGYTNTMALTESPHTHFPPGYPLLLAGFMKLFPENIVAAKLLNGFLLLASAFLLFFLIKKITRNALLALCVALLACMQVDVLSFSIMMMSEIPFLFVTTLTLYLAILLNARFSHPRYRIQDFLLLFFLLCFAIYGYFVRTIGTALVLSLILWFGFSALQDLWNIWKNRKGDAREQEGTPGRKRSLLGRVAVVALLALSFLAANHLWSERNAKMGKKEGMYLSEFTKKTGGEQMETLSDWGNRIQNNMVNFTAKWIPGALYGMEYDQETPPTAKQWVAGGLTALLLLAGLTGLGSAGLLLFFYVGGTLAVLLFFPEQFQGSRYIIAIIPWLIFLLLNGISRIIFYIGRWVAPRMNLLVLQSIVILCFTLFYLAPTYVKAQEDLREMAGFSSWKKTRNLPMVEYLEAVEWCAENLPDTARVVCRKPEIFYMYSGYRHAGGFPQYGEVDTLYQFLIDRKAEYLIIDSWFRHAYVTLYPVVQKYPEKFAVAHQIGTLDEAHDLYPTLILQFNPSWGYTGERVNGKKEGRGEELLRNGDKYVGEYARDLPNGYGEMYDASGQLLFKGIWKDGKPEIPR